MNYLCISGRLWLTILMVISIHVFCEVSYSQDVVVTGVVMNEQNQRVAGAEIKMGQTNSKTNSKGGFTLKANIFPAQLTIKHPLYKAYFEVVRASANPGDTIQLEIFLEEKSTELDEVTVNASRIIWAYDKKNTHIIDFALYETEMLLICAEKHHYFLRRLDSIGKKIVDVQIKKNPVGLYTDCTGGTHLVYADSIFEIKFIRNSIGMLSGNSFEKTMKVLSPCVISSPDNIILKRLGPHNKLVEYVKVDWNTKKPSLLYLTSDRMMMRQLDEFASDNDLAVAYSDPNYRRPNIPNNLTEKQQWDNDQFYNQILKKPLYAPIFEINDSVYVFDHFKDSAIVYSLSGNRIRSFQFSYHYFENWKSELFLNEEKTKLYARYESDGLVTLRQIDPSTGRVVNVDVLEKHIHPMNIQIRGNFAYYIYKHYLDNSIHYLYKQPLKK
ncbi:MAG: hypothetical protein ACO1N0_05225 [Fluviicola sp.]